MTTSSGVMFFFVVAMLITYVGIAVKRFHKTVAALVGAGVLTVAALALGLFEYERVYEIMQRDLNIFGVIIGTSILVDVTGKSGLFHFLSMQVIRATRGRADRVWLAVCLMSFVFTTFLTIVPAMLILSSLVLVISRSLGYKPTPLLISVAIGANSGALVTFASGLPNLVIGTAANIPYLQFLVVSAPYAVVSMVIAMWVLRRSFSADLPWRQDLEEQAELEDRIAEFDPWALVEDRRVLVRSGLILSLTIVGFALAQFLGVGVDFVAMAGGTAALLFAGEGVEETIAKVDWTVILFFAGLFLLIGAVEATGALERAAESVVDLSGGQSIPLIALLTTFSAVTSGVVDNIPVAATLIPIVRSIASLGLPVEPLWWSLIIATNLGGNATPIGSISCVIALHTLEHEEGVVVGWGEFIRIGGLVMVLQVVGGIGFLLIYNALGLFPNL